MKIAVNHHGYFFFLAIYYGNKKGTNRYLELLNPGNVLLSHLATNAVPSAMRGLTAVFGMGTGVSLSL
jgi:hypothetical protein